MCTYNGYYTTFDERERGSLEAGKIADMVLLDRNPYDIPKEELASVKVKQLYLRGQEYKKGNGGGAAQILRGMIKRENADRHFSQLGQSYRHFTFPF